MEEVIFIFIYVGLGCVVMAAYTASFADELDAGDYVMVGLGVCFWPLVAAMLTLGGLTHLLVSAIRRLRG